MGASASMGILIDEDTDFAIYREISHIYESEFLSKIKSGAMTEKDAYMAIKSKYLDLAAKAKATPDKVKPGHGDRKLLSWEAGTFATKFHIGDVVSVEELDVVREGVVLELSDQDKVIVDFGDFADEYNTNECTMLVRSDQFEVGDKVEVKDAGLYFLGNIVGLNDNGTYDIVMMGDDPEDIERGVSKDNLRKVMTKRDVALSKFRKASLAVVASTKMLKHIRLTAESEDIGDSATDRRIDLVPSSKE